MRRAWLLTGALASVAGAAALGALAWQRGVGPFGAGVAAASARAGADAPGAGSVVARAARAWVDPARTAATRRAPLQEENTPYDGRFKFVRVRYTEGNLGFGFGYNGEPYWHHDFPRAETHLAQLLAELTLVPTHLGPGNILTLDDPELFKYPVAYLSEPGHWIPNDKEVKSLRAYLLKGGFLIFDDFAGERDLENLRIQMRKVLPEGEWAQLTGSEPIFHSFFDINSLDYRHPYWRRLQSVWYGMFEDNDPKKRMLAVADYNNDVGEYWEWSGTGFFPVDLSNEAYKFGINYMVYGMTH